MGFLTKNKRMILISALLFGTMALTEGSALHYHEREAKEKVSKLDYITGVLIESRTGLKKADEARLARLILSESEKYGLDPMLVLAVIKTESTYYNWARSHRGARGLMQIMPHTGRWAARKLALKWRGIRTLYDPYTNVKMGIFYLSALKKRYGGDTLLTLAAYNAGPTRLAAIIRKGRRPPSRYARSVLANYLRLRMDAGIIEEAPLKRAAIAGDGRLPS